MRQRIVQIALVVACVVVAFILACLTHTADLITPQPWIGQ